MCGIVGGVSRQSNIVPFLLEGLRTLEYRGYDSAGLTVQTAGRHERYRATGRVKALAELLQNARGGRAGIAHTRWATHGVPCDKNAHPQSSATADWRVDVVHNGIIENHEVLRTALLSRGYTFTSDTDTEVVAHLLHWNLGVYGNLHEAFLATRRELHGLFALAVMEQSNDNLVYATRQGAPLVLGISQEGHFLASDVSALLSKTNQVVYLEDGDVVSLTSEDWQVVDAQGSSVRRPVVRSLLDADSVSLGGYQHYMQKEIFEQPQALTATLERAGTVSALNGVLFGPEAPRIFANAQQVLILACGTSYHAGLVARNWIETLVGLPCHVEVASEFRYREPALRDNTLVVVISQSGETADTRAALEYVQQRGLTDSLVICNVAESSLTRLARLKYLTRAGAEIGVASTKAFTTQLAALYLLALSLASAHDKLRPAELAHRLAALQDVSHVAQASLAIEPRIQEWAARLATSSSAIFIGRGVLHPIALEGALKLKEITYIHAEGYAAGELKHGPLALIDENLPVVVSLAADTMLDKTRANIEEVIARKGPVFVVADPGCHLQPREGVHVLELPQATTPELAPLVHVIALQLLAYHTALARGTDIDKPRNLAKSVTVE